MGFATRLSVHALRGYKERGERFAMVTAYDYLTAQILDEAGVPVLLVGDSLGMVVQGYDSTAARHPRRDAPPHARGRPRRQAAPSSSATCRS